jgi:chromosome segregation ATPase
MNWEEKLSELGLTQETISHGLKTKIKDHEKIGVAIEELQERLEDESTDEEEIEEIEQDLEDLTEAHELSNEKLIRAIEVYDKNKDKYAEMSKHLGRGRPRKNPLPQPNPQPNPQPQAQPQAQVQTQTQTQVPQNIPLTPTEEVVDDKKGKVHWGWKLGLALVVGVLTLGAYNTYKNND